MKRIDLNNKTILVTGGAGFIGSNLIKRLFKDAKGATIVNIDNMNDYYDVALKESRLEELEALSGSLCSGGETGGSYIFVKGDLADKAFVDKLFEEYKFDVVVNLAAQAGVRYSITNPDAYIMSNMIGFYNILEACRHSYDNVANAGIRINDDTVGNDNINSIEKVATEIPVTDQGSANERKDWLLATSCG